VGLLGLIGQTVVLGIAAAFTPMLLALQVLIVSGDPWRRRSLAVAVGGASAFILVGALLMLGFAQLPTVSLGVPTTTGAVLWIAAGAVLVVIAVALFRPHPHMQEKVEADIRGYMARASSWVFLGIAFALSIKDLSSFVVLAPALHDIAVADIDVVVKSALVVLLYALALSPVLAPPALRLLFGHRIDGVFRGVYSFTMAHQFQIVGSMAAAVAVFLLGNGIARLVAAS
jgi:hypothetical protein